MDTESRTTLRAALQREVGEVEQFFQDVDCERMSPAEEQLLMRWHELNLSLERLSSTPHIAHQSTDSTDARLPLRARTEGSVPERAVEREWGLSLDRPHLLARLLGSDALAVGV